MFTFCFTTVAAAQLRRIREIPKSTRQTTVAIRTVKLGLATMAVLAIASMAQAGGFSVHPAGSLSNMASRNNGGSLFNQSNQSNAIQFKANGAKLNSDKTKLEPTKPLTLDKALNTKSPSKIVKANDGTSLVLGKGPGKVIDLTGKSSQKSCDPCHTHCCPWWYCWNYPCWHPLYGCDCGDWCDVPVVASPQGLDLQLFAVRTIDSGDPEKQLGPALRVWFRNNSGVAINHPFNVLALAARDAQPTADLPQAGVRVDSIEAGQILAVDVRLPVEANQPGFPMFHVLVDSHREIPEVDKTNNGLVINRGDVQTLEIARANGGDTPTTTAATPAASTTNSPSDASSATTSSVPVAMQNVPAEWGLCMGADPSFGLEQTKFDFSFHPSGRVQ
jgi:hypothetical protein